MDDNKDKVVINSKDGHVEILRGNAFHVLEDHTTKTIHTTSIKTLADYIKTLTAYQVYYSANSIDVLPEEKDRYTLPIISCSLGNSDVLNEVIRMNHKTYNKHNLMILLKQTMPFLNSDGVNLLQRLRKFRITANSTTVQEDDDSGAILLESKEQNKILSIEIPEKIVFGVPVFKYHPEIIYIEFVLEVKVTEEDNQLLISFHNFDYVDKINETKKEIIEDYLKECDCKYWGSHLFNIATDSWKYLHK